MLLILVAIAALIYGVVWIGRELTVGQRVVLVLVSLMGVGWLITWVINAGWLGRNSH
jgi:hypothetical protein